MTLAANPRSLVLYMAYPGPGNLDGASRSLIDGAYLLKALDHVLADKGFGAIELTSLKSKTLQKEVAKRVKASNKKVAFHCEPVQWTNEENLIDPADLGCPNEVQRRRAVERIVRLLDEAALYGAEQVFVASGRNPASGLAYDQNSVGMQDQALIALTHSLRTLCGEAKKRKMKLGVSICDAGSPDGGVRRHALIGPTSRAVALAETLRSEGHDNFGL